jgi:hypothetical protein
MRRRDDVVSAPTRGSRPPHPRRQQEMLRCLARRTTPHKRPRKPRPSGLDRVMQGSGTARDLRIDDERLGRGVSISGSRQHGVGPAIRVRTRRNVINDACPAAAHQRRTTTRPLPDASLQLHCAGSFRFSPLSCPQTTRPQCPCQRACLPRENTGREDRGVPTACQRAPWERTSPVRGRPRKHGRRNQQKIGVSIGGNANRVRADPPASWGSARRLRQRGGAPRSSLAKELFARVEISGVHRFDP